MSFDAFTDEQIRLLTKETAPARTIMKIPDLRWGPSDIIEPCQLEGNAMKSQQRFTLIITYEASGEGS